MPEQSDEQLQMHLNIKVWNKNMPLAIDWMNTEKNQFQDMQNIYVTIKENAWHSMGINVSIGFFRFFFLCFC